MNKKHWILLAVLVLVIDGVYLFTPKPSSAPAPAGSAAPTSQSFDPKNSTFTIDGQSVTLANGVLEVAIPNSSAKVVTRYFGNEATGALDGNGSNDVAFLVTQETGGSGVFYYVVAALKTASGYKTTNAVLIGDRIAPQSTRIQSDTKELDVDYADRKPGEPMTAQPTVGEELKLQVTADGILQALEK